MSEPTEPVTHRSAIFYGLPNSPDGYALRDFLTRNDFPFEWRSLNSTEEAKCLAGVDGLEDPRLPVCILSGGSILFHPTTRDLACALDSYKGPRHREYDLAIYGAGPAGLSAAVYGASEGLRTIVIERSAVGGQAGSTSRIENYLGFPDGISGWDLASRARQQAQRLGAEIIITAEGVGGESLDGWTVSRLASGEEIRARATICATGVDYTRLDLPDESTYLNRGLFYGAGPSEARLCTGHVFVVGGGNSSGQAALNFAVHADKVTMLVRGKALKDSLSSYLIDQIDRSPNIQALMEVEVFALRGEGSLEEISFRHVLSGDETTVKTNWLFICIGGTPRTGWARPGTLRIDEAGYILTGEDLAAVTLPRGFWRPDQKPLSMEASMPGLFAAGDVRHNSIKRCASAVGDGANAVAMVHQYMAVSAMSFPFSSVDCLARPA